MFEHLPNARDAAQMLFNRPDQLSSDALNECLDSLIQAGIWYDEPRGRWLLSGHNHVRAALTHRHLLNDLRLAKRSTKSWSLARRLQGTAPSMLFVDPPIHTVLRTQFAGRFSASTVAALAPWIATQARHAVEKVGSSDEFDLGVDLVQPYAAGLIRKALGCAELQRLEMLQLIQDLFAVNKLFDLTASAEDVHAGRVASARVREQSDASLGTRTLGGGAIAKRDLRDLAISSVEFSLRAGAVTTSCLLTHILMRRFAGDARAATPDVETMIAMSSPTFEAGRVSTAVIEIDGFEIPARETVICVLPAANRDLILRGGPIHRQVTFGSGRHRCLGQHLVREGTRALVAAVENAGRRLEVVGPCEYHHTPSFCGVRKAPVRWREWV